jgi:ABC-type Fe3+-hydroxamate transport system substrate-binding protein
VAVEPQRVVSLCPSITETLVAIGGLARLVGATRYCVRPKKLLRGLARVGGTKSPDLDRVLALEPDLVFANEEENRKEDVEELRRLGVEVDVSFPRRVTDVPSEVRQWGRRLGGESVAAAETLASRIESAIETLSAGSRPADFPYAYWIWKDPWMTVSDDTYVADLLRLSGGINVFGGEPVRYPAVSPPQAVARGARVHFFPTEPYPFRKHRHDRSTRELFGARCRRLFVDGDDYCWHGARTLQGLEEMGRIRITLGEIKESHYFIRKNNRLD